MAKLPKKSTMLDTIGRVKGYTYKLYVAQKITMKEFQNISLALSKLSSAINK